MDYDAKHNPVLERYRELWRHSIQNPEEFWDGIARNLIWRRHYNRVLRIEHPYCYWFEGGKLNVNDSIFSKDRGNRKNHTALIWESENGESEILSYGRLERLVQSFAGGLKDFVGRGDVVTLYMPMVPEAMVAMLACARIGAVHNVVFAGFGREALEERMKMTGSKLLITADVGYRRGRKIRYWDVVKEVDAEKVVLVREGLEGDFHRFDDLSSSGKVKPEPVNSTDPLFILHTSGTTGKPKGVVHAAGSYAVWCYAHVKWLFDFRKDDIFFSTVDIGWINGHSYGTYGPLLNGATILWYEGVPDYRNAWWRLVEEYEVTKMWVAPTAVRLLMKSGCVGDLSSLELLVSAGEILGRSAWEWLVEVTGGKCHVVETWGQTENSGYITSPVGFGLGGIVYRQGSVGLPLPSIDVAIFDENGKEVKRGEKGYVVVRSHSPAFMAFLWNDDGRYREYYERFGVYMTGDYGYMDEDGFVYILGRVDDVVKVSGYRLSPYEVENAVSSCDAVAECAVVARPSEVKGHELVAFVVLKDGYDPSEELRDNIKKTVREKVGAIAVPEVVFVEKLPKTRTGKVVRRVLRALLSGGELGDVSTFEEGDVIDHIRRVLDQG